MTTTESPRNAWRRRRPAPPAGAGRPGRTTRTSCTWCRRTAMPRSPAPYLAQHIEPQYLDRIPRVERARRRLGVGDHRGQSAAARQARRGGADRPGQESFEQPEHDRHAPARMEPEDVLRNTSGTTIEQRLADQAADGVDVELIFPNKGLLCWATPDPVFADAMCRAWNRWAYDWFGGAGGWNDGRTRPLACLATGDIDLAMAEATWAAEHGFVGLCLGNSPVYGPKAVGPAGVQRSAASSRSGRSPRSSACRSRSTSRRAVTRGPSGATAERSSTTSATAWRRRSSRSSS